MKGLDNHLKYKQNEMKNAEIDLKEVARYVDGLTDDQLARWMTLIYAEQLIGRYCKDDIDCIAEKNSKIEEYMRARVPDMKQYIQLTLKGDDVPTLDEFFLVSGSEEAWFDAR